MTSLPLFGARIIDADRAELVRRMTAPQRFDGVRTVVTMNLDHVVQLQKNPAFRAAYDRAWAVTIDGAPVAAYARLKGLRRPRCTGADLLVDLVPALDPARHRPFFVVSAPETQDGLARLMADLGFAPGSVGFAVPPFGFEADSAASDALETAIVAHRASHLIFGLGAPKSEIWIDQRRDRLGDLYALAVGSAPDFLIGRVARAPESFQRLGLEWLWRLASEPRRLARRYLIDSWAFLPAAARDFFRR